MSIYSKIEWTDTTWNPIVGCSRISAGCKNCYAEKASRSPRLRQFPQYQAVQDWDGTTEFVPSQIQKPLKWKQPRRIFVCSMSDLFHEQNPEAWIDSIFAIAALSRQHTFQILTKRPLFAEAYFDVVGRKKRILERANQIDRLSSLPWPLPNVWLGTSVENDSVSGRIMLIKGVKAALHFASVEPLLMRLNKKTLSLLSELDWVIIGGESGGGARPLHVEWVRDIVELLEKKDGVSCFVKQLGSQPYFGMRKLRLKSRKGSDPSEWPIEFPRDFPLKK